MPGKIIPKSYFVSDDVIDVSKSLIGKVLCTQFDDCLTKGIIVETEAYRAPEDKASHAYGNKHTARTAPMFLEGGRSYVYLCYGIHHLFNIVTGGINRAHAVLIRAVEPLEGIDHMLTRRKLKKICPSLTAGPGILTKALGITTTQTNKPLIRENSIWIEDHDFKIDTDQIISSPRVGVEYAEECATWPWRFRLRDNKWCSPAK